MAWFDPPLHRPGNQRCPNCGQPQRWTVALALHDEWACRACNSPLTLDPRRKEAARAVLIAAACAAGAALAIFTDWGKISILFAAPIFILLLMPMWYWAASVRLKSTDAEEEQRRSEGPARRQQGEQSQVSSVNIIRRDELDTVPW